MEVTMRETREKEESEEVYLDPIIKIRKTRELENWAGPLSQKEPTALETFGAKGHPPKMKVITCGVRETFGDLAQTIAWTIVDHLQTEVLKSGPQNYLQEFEVTAEEKTVKVWVIDESEAITLLLPDEY